MNLASIRIITHDVARLTQFYETLTGETAARPAPIFAEIQTGAGTIAIAGPDTVAMLGEHAPRPGSNDTVIVECQWPVVSAHGRPLKVPAGGQ